MKRKTAQINFNFNFSSSKLWIYQFIPIENIIINAKTIYSNNIVLKIPIQIYRSLCYYVTICQAFLTLGVARIKKM